MGSTMFVRMLVTVGTHASHAQGGSLEREHAAAAVAAAAGGTPLQPHRCVSDGCVPADLSRRRRCRPSEARVEARLRTTRCGRQSSGRGTLGSSTPRPMMRRARQAGVLRTAVDAVPAAKQRLAVRRCTIRMRRIRRRRRSPGRPRGAPKRRAGLAQQRAPRPRARSCAERTSCRLPQRSRQAPLKLLDHLRVAHSVQDCGVHDSNAATFPWRGARRRL